MVKQTTLTIHHHPLVRGAPPWRISGGNAPVPEVHSPLRSYLFGDGSLVVDPLRFLFSILAPRVEPNHRVMIAPRGLVRKLVHVHEGPVKLQILRFLVLLTKLVHRDLRLRALVATLFDTSNECLRISHTVPSHPPRGPVHRVRMSAAPPSALNSLQNAYAASPAVTE